MRVGPSTPTAAGAKGEWDGLTLGACAEMLEPSLLKGCTGTAKTGRRGSSSSIVQLCARAAEAQPPLQAASLRSGQYDLLATAAAECSAAERRMVPRSRWGTRASASTALRACRRQGVVGDHGGAGGGSAGQAHSGKD